MSLPRSQSYFHGVIGAEINVLATSKLSFSVILMLCRTVRREGNDQEQQHWWITRILTHTLQTNMENSANILTTVWELWQPWPKPAPPISVSKTNTMWQALRSSLTFFQSPTPQLNGNDSANEVHDNKVQDGAGKEKISKGSLRGDALEIRFVLWVDLYSQTNCTRRKTQKWLSRSMKQVWLMHTHIPSDPKILFQQKWHISPSKGTYRYDTHGGPQLEAI